jgi:hypothetical protein
MWLAKSASAQHGERGARMREFVIERTNETKREWWTGSAWSEDDRQARWYATEPDAPEVTQDENARAVRHPAGVIDD